MTSSIRSSGRKHLTGRLHRSNSKRLSRRPAAFERLEDRRMMTADFASGFAIGGALNDAAYDLGLDGAGNTCVVGRFTGTVDFDPGVGVTELTSVPSSSSNTFAGKYDPNGNLLWVQRVGGTAANFGPEITAGDDGTVCLVGSFTGSADFGATTLTSLGDSDAFVTKVDASGNFVWAKRFGGVNADWGNDVAVDRSGNVFVMAETRSSASGNPDATIAKLDAAGNLLWTKSVGASSSTTTKGKSTTTSGWARGFKLTVDSAGDVYGTGRISGTVDFDAGPGTTALSGSGFVMKLSSGGNLVWARTFEGGTIEPHDIAVDDSGNVYTAGYYGSSVDFDPGASKAQQFILSASVDGGIVSPAYVSALNPSGNFLWAKSSRSTSGSIIVEAIDLDGAGGLYLTGAFNGTTDFDPGVDTFNLTTAGGDDAFIWKLNTSGNFVWAGQISGSGMEHANGIGVDAAGNIFVTGFLNGTADFDLGPGTYNLTSAGGNDFFVAKFTQPVAPAAAQGQTSEYLANPPKRQLRRKAIDSALTSLGENESSGWGRSLDEALLLLLAL